MPDDIPPTLTWHDILPAGVSIDAGNALVIHSRHITALCAIYPSTKGADCRAASALLDPLSRGVERQRWTPSAQRASISAGTVVVGSVILSGSNNQNEITVWKVNV